ncbi:MAG: MFS transporter [Parachlamydiaceae bacterium]
MSQSQTPANDVAWQKTRTAFIWTSILNTPFWAIFNMLPFILFKDLHATPLQITIIIILKPAVSLFAPYWSSFIEKRSDRLLSNLIWARVLGHIPFFFFPLVDNPWFIIASFGFYMMLSRGTMPAWMEVLKLNVPNISREQIFAYGYSVGYIGAAVIAFALGWVMDAYFQSWRWIFPVTALISLGAIFFKSRIPIDVKKTQVGNDLGVEATPVISLAQQIIKPWKSAWELIRRRRDYARFQLGFMLGGSGLIIMQPVLPVFFMDGLNLSYTELAVGLTVCKGIGFALASPSWAAVMSKMDIYRFNSVVTVLAFVFPLCLLGAQSGLFWLYAGYVLYGVMQAGSEMSWHLSGPIFAGEEDSSVYSSINVLTVGLRGCVVPIVGSVLAYMLHASGVMLFGAALCLSASACMMYYSRQERPLLDTTS